MVTMKRLTVIAAALAAGLSHAALAKEAPDRAESMIAAAEDKPQAAGTAAPAADAERDAEGAAASAGGGAVKTVWVDRGRMVTVPQVDETTTAAVSAAPQAEAEAAAPAAAKPAPAKPAPATQQAAAGGRPFDAIITRYAGTYGVPLSLAHAVVSVESNYRADARGRAGEIGLMQLKLATARGMGYSGSAKALYNPETNIKYGMMYLGRAHQLGGGSTCGTILKYNAGHGAKRMNPISAAYCAKVKRRLGV